MDSYHRVVVLLIVDNLVVVHIVVFDLVVTDLTVVDSCAGALPGLLVLLPTVDVEQVETVEAVIHIIFICPGDLVVLFLSCLRLSEVCAALRHMSKQFAGIAI